MTWKLQNEQKKAFHLQQFKYTEEKNSFHTRTVLWFENVVWFISTRRYESSSFKWMDVLCATNLNKTRICIIVQKFIAYWVYEPTIFLCDLFHSAWRQWFTFLWTFACQKIIFKAWIYCDLFTLLVMKFFIKIYLSLLIFVQATYGDTFPCLFCVRGDENAPRMTNEFYVTWWG